MKYKEIWKVYNKVFDLQTFRNLNYLMKKQLVGKELVPISEGKEAIVFRSEGDYGPVAVKIYKVMSVSFKRRLDYLIIDKRFKDFPRTKIGLIYLWVKKEWSNLLRFYENNVSVPFPVGYRGNILVMEFIGNERPAPRLKDFLDDTEKLKDLLEYVKREYYNIIHNAKMVHADFSEYNILVWKNYIYVIDVAQGLLLTEDSIDFLVKDLVNVFRLYKRSGLDLSIDEFLEMFDLDKLDFINYDLLKAKFNSLL